MSHQGPSLYREVARPRVVELHSAGFEEREDHEDVGMGHRIVSSIPTSVARERR